MRGDDVRELQTFLIGQSLLTGDLVTGYFGPQTRAAVQQFQSARGIASSRNADSTGYGIVGPRTRSAIAQSGSSAVPPSSAPSSSSNSASLTATLQMQIQQLLARIAELQALQQQPSVSYSWQTESWSTCTNSTQSRVVSCRGSDDKTYSEHLCTASKLSESQSCTIAQAQSCSFNGSTVADGASVLAYQSSSVPFGQTCAPQTRACTNGTLSGSYQFSSCVAGNPTTCSFNGKTVAHGASVPAYQSASVPAGQSCGTAENRVCTSGILSGSFTNAACTVATRDVPYFGDPDTVKGPWSSYHFFGRRTQSIATNLSGVQVADRRIDFDSAGFSELKYCKKAPDGTWPAECFDPNIEQRVIKKGCVGGNDFFWLKGYKDSRGNRFRLEVVKAVVQFDDGRTYDITNNTCNYDSAGLADGIPYALFNIVDGYRMKIWFNQLDTNNKPTKLNYWEQHYTRERVTNQCWRGEGPNTLWAIVQRQTAWQGTFKDRNATKLETIGNGDWPLTTTSGGQLALQTFTAKFGGTFTTIAPTGVGTSLVWTSSNAMGKGMGWTSNTGDYSGQTCTADVKLL